MTSSALEQGPGRRVAHAVDLLVDERVLLDVGVRGRDVGLWLVVVVVADEVLDRVVWEELLFRGDRAALDPCRWSPEGSNGSTRLNRHGPGSSQEGARWKSPDACPLGLAHGRPGAAAAAGLQTEDVLWVSRMDGLGGSDARCRGRGPARWRGRGPAWHGLGHGGGWGRAAPPAAARRGSGAAAGCLVWSCPPHPPDAVGLRAWSRFERWLASAEVSEGTVGPNPRPARGSTEQAGLVSSLCRRWAESSGASRWCSRPAGVASPPRSGLPWRTSPRMPVWS